MGTLHSTVLNKGRHSSQGSAQWNAPKLKRINTQVFSAHTQRAVCLARAKSEEKEEQVLATPTANTELETTHLLLNLEKGFSTHKLLQQQTARRRQAQVSKLRGRRTSQDPNPEASVPNALKAEGAHQCGAQPGMR